MEDKTCKKLSPEVEHMNHEPASIKKREKEMEERRRGKDA